MLGGVHLARKIVTHNPRQPHFGTQWVWGEATPSENLGCGDQPATCSPSGHPPWAESP